jgi:hypothetical protein
VGCIRGEPNGEQVIEMPANMKRRKKVVADRPDRKVYDVKVRVISQRGDCGQGHKVGDEVVIKSANGSRHTPAGICLSAFNAFYPAVRTLAFVCA